MYNFREDILYMTGGSLHQPMPASNFFASKIRKSEICNLFALKILVSKKKYFMFSLMLGFYITVFAQQKITGVVKTNGGAPLAGATISLKGTNLAATAAEDGSFNITGKIRDVLVFSFIGYQTREIKIVDNTPIQVYLPESIGKLDEIVLIGYNSQKLKEITGSVAVVTSKELTAAPAGQVEQMLQGRVAGLTVITSGEPGAPAQIFLHGMGNFGKVTPLYIIDGVEGNINSINPYDIESLQVLKDAGAYSIYGARGANGVIVVTTKKGKNANTSVNYDFYLGLQEPLKKGLDILSPQEQGTLIWIADKNSGFVDANGNPSDPLYGNGPTPVMPDYLYAGSNNGLHEGDPRANPALYNLDYTHGPIYQIVPFDKKGTDWFHKSFKPAVSQNHTVSISGGNDRNKYLLSFGYLDQEGTFLNTYLKRFTVRVNTDFKVRKAFKFGENLQLSYIDNPRTNKRDAANYSDHSDLSAILTMPPYRPVFDIQGNWSSNNLPSAGPMDNPIFVRTVANNNKRNNWQVFGNAYAEADFLKHFSVRSSFGGSLNYFYSYNYSYGSWAPPPIGYDNSLSENSGYLRSWTWTNILNFSEKFKDKHYLKILIGTEEKSDYNRDQGGSGSGLYSNDPAYWLLNNALPGSQTNFSAATSSFLSSFISRIDYSFSDKYLLSATLRRDGSSLFGPENRFGWFPAVMGAWRLTEEKFIQKISWLNELKFRASWGKTGFNGNTNPINQYNVFGGSPEDAYYDIYGTSNSIVQGFRTVNIGNPKTGWQQDVVSNLGFETILLNEKLSITADWYVKNSKGLLFPISLPAILGIGTPPTANIGNVRNTGIDLLLGTKGSFSKNWRWDVNVNFSTYKNKILKLNVFQFFDYDSLLFTGLVRNEVGHPMGSFFGYKVIGYFKDNNDVAKSPTQDGAGPGRFKYLDANGDGHIDNNDRVFIGNPNPKFTAGINIGINYKDFDFSTFFYASYGNDVLNEFKWIMNVSPGASGKTALYDSWTPENKNPKAPVLEAASNFSNKGATNSYPIENGSFLKNKSIMIGYTLPKKSLDRLRMNRLRFYAQVVNLFTITSYTGLDPEMPGMTKAFGFDEGNYPNNQRQYLMGLNLNF